MNYFVYIVKCSDDSLYVGSTNELERRINEHNSSKKGAHYTKIRRPVELVYSEKFNTSGEARKRENVVKKLSREKKLELVKSSFF